MKCINILYIYIDIYRYIYNCLSQLDQNRIMLYISYKILIQFIMYLAALHLLKFIYEIEWRSVRFVAL